MAVRIWPFAQHQMTSPWRRVASAIREHGIADLSARSRLHSQRKPVPVFCSPTGINTSASCEPEIADALAAAYPKAVERVARATGMPDQRAAAAILLEGLLKPGFDPAMGAASARRYVNKKAAIAIRNHWKISDGGSAPGSPSAYLNAGITSCCGDSPLRSAHATKSMRAY